MVLGIKGSSGSESDGDELINVLWVGEVLVKVILEELDHVHVLLNAIISSDVLEWEGENGADSRVLEAEGAVPPVNEEL